MKKYFVRKIFLVFAAVAGFSSMVVAQEDTLQRYPFFYHYNFPETGSHDSINCSVDYNGYYYGPNCRNDGRYGYEVAIFQHTDVPLRAVGIAFSEVQCYGRICKLSLYYPDMKMMAVAFSKDYRYDEDWSDSISHYFILPGRNGFPAAHHGRNEISLKYAFFDNPIDLDSGDYYIGFGSMDSLTLEPKPTGNLPTIYEAHLPPYHFDTTQILYYYDSTWNDCILPQLYHPALFLIIEPKCRVVEGVRVAVDTAGCVGVEWDSLPWQTQWVLRLTGGGGVRYDTVDSCRFTYCGLNPDAHYEVSVQSQCFRPGGHNWSEWSAAVPLDDNAIPAVAGDGHRLRLMPNPAAGRVTVSAEGVEGLATVSLYDAGGAEVLRRERVELPLTLATDRLPAGVYLLRLDAGDFTATEKLVIAH